ncbi:MAG: O-antigen ligase family protein [Caldilineaceae bacterium]|nr:O-antigen ligase family protein [Caldilineaceae bacterium]
MTATLHRSDDPARDRRLLVTAWLGGATVMAALGVWQFAAGTMTITAEGVQRVRGLYGSPNNLALYLERTLAVTLALALFLRRDELRPSWIATPWSRVLLVLAALVQGAALLLTFSKGALFIAVPVMLAVLWLGGLGLLRRQGRTTRPLWALAGLAALLLLALLPFLGTARFQRIFDLSQGTGFLRLQLWRSAWQMALDHPLLGIGPDNFLYQYRSRYLLPTAWQEPNLNHPHNWLLDWWTRLGIPGLLLGLWYWGAGLAVIWRGYRRAWDNAAALCLGLLAASAAALAHGLIDVSYALPDLMLVWSFMFALALSLADAGKSDRG